LEALLEIVGLEVMLESVRPGTDLGKAGGKELESSTYLLQGLKITSINQFI